MNEDIRTIGHKGGPQHGAGPIQLSADGKLFAVGCNDGVYFYAVDSLQQVAQLDASPVQLAFTPDGNQIVTGGIGTRVTLWEISNESSVWDIEATDKRSWVRSVDISPDGRWIASGATDKTARIWDAMTGDAICEFDDHTGGNVFDVAFSPDSSKLATACFDGRCRVFDLDERKLLHSFEGFRERGGQHVYSNVFSDDGELIVSAAPHGGVLVWRTETCEVVCECKNANEAVGALFLPGNKRVITSHYPGWVKLYDVDSGKCLRTLQAHDGRTQNAALTPCGRTLVTTSMDAKIRLWDIETLTQKAEINGHKSEITDLCYSSDGRHVATAHLYGGASLWDLQTERAIALPYYAMHAGRSVAASRSGKLIAYDSDQHVYVYDAERMEHLSEFRRGNNGEHGIWWGQRLTFVGDNRRLAFASDSLFDEQRPIVIWDVHAKQIERLVVLPAGFSVVAFSPDGTRAVVSGGDDKGLIVRLDEESPHVEYTLSKAPTAWAISHDNQTMCVGHRNGIPTWLYTSDCTVEDKAPKLNVGSSISAIEFSSDGQYLAVCNDDVTSVWSYPDGEGLATTEQKGLLIAHPHDSEFAIASNSRVHLWRWKSCDSD